MHLFFSVGEPSGDQHAAHLIQALRRRRPDLRFSGFGGPQMKRCGCELLYPLTNLAVMGIVQVIPLLFRFFRLLREAGRYLRDQKPDAVILVDFPGFNWWIARKAKAAGIPVFYYLPPQLWAWAPWRIRRVRKFVDHVLCSLPFEKTWFEQRGVAVEYVGHPFFDEVLEHPLDEDFCSEWFSKSVRNIAILPGSRNEEVARNWPVMLDVMEQLHRQHPSVRFLVANYQESQQALCKKQLALAQNRGRDADLPVHFFVGKTSEVIHRAECCLMVSGSVSLEVLARGKPAVVLYRLGWVFAAIGRLVVTCKYISLPNLIAGCEVMPEVISVRSPGRVAPRVTAILGNWLSNPQQMRAVAGEMAELREHVVKAGATGRAADVILQKLSQRANRNDSVAA